MAKMEKQRIVVVKEHLFPVRFFRVFVVPFVCSGADPEYLVSIDDSSPLEAGTCTTVQHV
jgi:hypothetical protein